MEFQVWTCGIQKQSFGTFLEALAYLQTLDTPSFIHILYADGSIAGNFQIPVHRQKSKATTQIATIPIIGT